MGVRVTGWVTCAPRTQIEVQPGQHHQKRRLGGPGERVRHARDHQSRRGLARADRAAGLRLKPTLYPRREPPPSENLISPAVRQEGGSAVSGGLG